MRLDWFVSEFNKSEHARDYGKATKARVKAVLEEQGCDIGQYEDSEFDYIAELYMSHRDFVSVSRATTKKKEDPARLEESLDIIFPLTPELLRFEKCEVIEAEKPPYSMQPESARELRGQARPHFWIFKHSGETVPYKATPDIPILEQAINLPLPDNPFLDEPPREVLEFFAEWGPTGVLNIFASRFKHISREIKAVRRGKSDFEIPADWPSLWDIHICVSGYDLDELERIINEAGFSMADFRRSVSLRESDSNRLDPKLALISNRILEEAGMIVQESWSLTHYYLAELQACYEAWRSTLKKEGTTHIGDANKIITKLLFDIVNSRLGQITIELIEKDGSTMLDFKASSMIETLYGLLAKDMIGDVDWRKCQNEYKPDHDFRRIKDNRQIYCGTQCRQQMADAARGKTGKKAARGSAK